LPVENKALGHPVKYEIVQKMTIKLLTKENQPLQRLVQKLPFSIAFKKSAFFFSIALKKSAKSRAKSIEMQANRELTVIYALVSFSGVHVYCFFFQPRKIPLPDSYHF